MRGPLACEACFSLSHTYCLLYVHSTNSDLCKSCAFQAHEDRRTCQPNRRLSFQCVSACERCLL